MIKFIEEILMGTNVEVSWVDSSAPVESYEEAIKSNTKVNSHRIAGFFCDVPISANYTRCYIGLQILIVEILVFCN